MTAACYVLGSELTEPSTETIDETTLEIVTSSRPAGLVSASQTAVWAGGYFCLAMAREGSRLNKEFKTLDTNGDKFLTLSEYRADESHGLPEVSKKYTFLVLDTDHDGRLGDREYELLPWQVAGVHCVLEHGPVPVAAGPGRNLDLAEFAQFDRDDDLRMTFQEYQDGRATPQQEAARAQFDQLDGDTDGQLNIVEFSKRTLDVTPAEPIKFEGEIDPALLRVSPPLSGAVYARRSGHAIEALVRLAQTNARTRSDTASEITIVAGVDDGPIDPNGDGKVSESECWEYLYQNRPEQSMPRLAFMSSRDGDAQIYVLHNAGATKKLQLTPPRSDCRSPQLSPDGRWIAFHSKHDDKKPGLFIVRSTGGEPRHLTGGRDAISRMAICMVSRFRWDSISCAPRRDRR